MNQKLVAQAQQIEQLSQRYAETAVHHQMVLQDLARVHKTILNHEHIIENVMTFLHSVDAKLRRDSKIMFNPGETGATAHLTPPSPNVAVPDDEPASPLQQASKLLNDLNAEVKFHVASVDQSHDLPGKIPGLTSTPPADHQLRNVNRGPQSAESSSTMGFARLNHGELDQVVYPMGISNGIDPMYSEHVHNIPYPMPAKDLDLSDPRRRYPDNGRKKSTFADPGWSRPPRILLVEDDPTCRQIGGKFLYSFCCEIDTAVRDAWAKWETC